MRGTAGADRRRRPDLARDRARGRARDDAVRLCPRGGHQRVLGRRAALVASASAAARVVRRSGPRRRPADTGARRRRGRLATDPTTTSWIRLRLPLRLPHQRPGRPGWIGRMVVPAALRSSGRSSITTPGSGASRRLRAARSVEGPRSGDRRRGQQGGRPPGDRRDQRRPDSTAAGSSSWMSSTHRRSPPR